MTPDLVDELRRILPTERILAREIDRIAFANDASVYRLVPRVVVLPETVSEIQALFRVGHARSIPLTFRAAGTSLSGQAVTDGILVVLSRDWREVEVRDDGRKVRVQPGVIGGVVNRTLAPFGAKIGPDPASIDSCMMGGILANNSSGMCCGVAQNAYHTLDSMRFVLPDGVEVDTAAPARFESEAPRVAAGLLELKREIEANPDLVVRIKRKYAMKNTMGYSLNAFLDYSRPADILSHLMIGSEGTLGFIAEAVLNTVPDYRFKYTGLLFFENIPQACESIEPLRESGARALELMDRASLRSMGGPPRAAALLVEYQCESEIELERCRQACDAVLPELPLVDEPEMTLDPVRQSNLWRVRKGLIPSVGAMRARGTSFIIEDVVFPVARLAQGVADLQALLMEFRYDDAIVFGHAKDGNLHFVLTQSFAEPNDVARYDGFMHALARLVADEYGGALKAEHGTGRNMTPFVAQEWGDDAYDVMRRVKSLVDPAGVLNPGVVINSNPQAHVTHLKPLPTVEPEVDACIECGFCEHMCPSRDLTLTPRQRIVVRREMARLRSIDPASRALRQLEADYRYDALDTCAADGLCALACPVGIDTGKLVKRLRREGRSEVQHELAVLAANRIDWIETIAGFGRRLALHVTPPVPGRGAKVRPDAPVFFETCVNRVLGPVAGVAQSVATAAGVELKIPDDARGHCCGMPFASKGFHRAYQVAINKTIDSFWRWSGEGAVPVVVDSSPCAYTLRSARPDLNPRNQQRFDAMTVLDGIEFAHDHLLPALPPARRCDSVALHPVCSVRKLGIENKFSALARYAAHEVVVPIHAGCCGFAGDRGFTVPQLTKSAMRDEAAEVAGRNWSGCYSSSRTCEIGLTRATGQSYRSFWHLLAEAID